MSFGNLELPPARKGTGQLAPVAADFNAIREAMRALDLRTQMLYPVDSPTIKHAIDAGGTRSRVVAPGSALAARFQFEAYTEARPDESDPQVLKFTLVGAPGVLNAPTPQSLAETTAQPAEPITDPEWFFLLTANIDSATGNLQSVYTEWNTSTTSATTPSSGTQNITTVLATAVFDAGVIQEMVQGAYGPCWLLLHGGATDAWDGAIF